MYRNTVMVKEYSFARNLMWKDGVAKLQSKRGRKTTWKWATTNFCF